MASEHLGGPAEAAGRARLRDLNRTVPATSGKTNRSASCGTEAVSLDITDIVVHHACMPNELVSLRLPAELLERIDEHAADLTEYTGGVPITRAEVIRKFITEGLAHVDAGARRPKKK